MGGDSVHPMSRDEDGEIDPAEALEALAAQVAGMIQRGRHTVDLIRGVPGSKEGRRLGTEIRGLLAELGGAKREVDTLRRAVRGAKTRGARDFVAGQLHTRSADIRALLQRADEAIMAAASTVASGAPALERPRTHHDRPTYPGGPTTR